MKRLTNPLRRSLLLAALVCLSQLAVPCARAQERAAAATERDRKRGVAMLRKAWEEVRKNYYDPNFRGLDVEARVRAAEEGIRAARTVAQINVLIAQVLDDLGDSHTAYFPPDFAHKVDYGWRMQLVGDRCYVVSVRRPENAAGLKVGDEVVAVDELRPTRENLPAIRYVYGILSPRQSLRLAVRSPAGEARTLELKPHITKGREVISAEHADRVYERWAEREAARESLTAEPGGGLLVWRLNTFDAPARKIDDVMKKARKYDALVLDLRGNGGGSEETLRHLIGYFFDREVKVGETKTRKGVRPWAAKPKGESRLFRGRLTVLVDSDSASAAEVFARVVQLERRGAVVGDRTAGAVMASVYLPHEYLEDDRSYAYGVSVTVADLLMSDGKSLEGVGVVPDEVMLPTPADLAARLDPVLARAASAHGVRLDPAAAYALFPRDDAAPEGAGTIF
jgi:C-terminal processing protease CtpA/Prc